MIGIEKRLETPPAKGVQSVTYCVGQGVPVMETALLLAHEPVKIQVNAPDLGAGLVVREMTQRDMVRAVIPPVGAPITNGEIREEVAQKFGDRAPTARQVAQTIVGLRRDGELVQVSHGVQQATNLLGHPRIPSDPTRTRARS